MNNDDRSILTLLKEIRSLIDKNLKSKLNLGNFTMPQTMIIYNLVNNDKMKISDLSEKMGLTNSTVSGIVDRLEDQGVVTRERSIKDRRVVYVELTPENKKKYLDMNANLDRYFQEMLEDLSPEQINNVLDSLGLLKNALIRYQEMKTL